MKHIFLASIFSFVFLNIPGVHAAEQWPSRAIKIMVGFSAGSSPDVQARMLAEPLSKALGQSVIVENKPGAGGNIGADAVAKAEDGHTIGVIGNGPLTSSKFLYSKLPYDPVKEFAPIALIGSAPMVWVIESRADIQNAAQFIAYAKERGSQLAFGSVGAGSATHLGVELLKISFGINPIHVPYSGGPAVLNALLGGQIQMAMLPTSTALPLAQAGKIKAIAVTSHKPSALAPTIPSMEEIGENKFSIEVWNAVMAPSSMPVAHQKILSETLQKIIESRDMRQKLFLQGWRVDDASVKSLSVRIQADTTSYENVIRKNNIKID